MHNSRLINILQSFTKKEQRHCRAWIHCDLHNQRKDVCDLYDFLWEMELKEQYLTKSLAWASIYPKDAYNDGKMRQIVHRLLLAVEDFLSYTQMKNKGNSAAIFLLETLRERKLFSVLDKTIKSTQQAQKKEPFQNWESLRFDYEFETIRFNAAEQQQRTMPLNLQELSDALDIQYFADKLRKACLLYSRLVVFKMDYQPKMLEVVLDQVKELNYLNIPAIGIYYHCYLSMTAHENADIHFEKMITHFHQYAKQFPPQEIRELYLLAINYTIKQLNTGSKGHLEKAFELYKSGITEGYLIKEGILSSFTYNNMVSIGLQMQRYEWIEQFVYDYKNSMIEEQRESNFQESLAKLYYAKGEYQAAKKILKNISIKDILRILSCKTLLARIYYETNELDALEALLDSLKMYLRRKEVVGYHKEMYQNMMQLMQKLVRVNPFDKHAKAKLRQEIEQTKILSTKGWLLEQVDSL